MELPHDARADPGLLLLLDYDGTLCATHDAIADALGRLFEARRLPRPSAQRMSELVGTGATLPETIRMLHPYPRQLADRELAELTTEYRRIYAGVSAACVSLFPEVKETLRRLRDVADLAVMSNKGAAAVNASLERLGVREFISAVIADEPGRMNKPDPRVFPDRVAHHFPRATPRRTLVVGDTEADLHFARAAGLTSCWAAYGYGCEPRCIEIGFDYRVGAFSELPAIVTELQSRFGT